LVDRHRDDVAAAKQNAGRTQGPTRTKQKKAAPRSQAFAKRLHPRHRHRLRHDPEPTPVRREQRRSTVGDKLPISRMRRSDEHGASLLRSAQRRDELVIEPNVRGYRSLPTARTRAAKPKKLNEADSQVAVHGARLSTGRRDARALHRPNNRVPPKPHDVNHPAHHTTKWPQQSPRDERHNRRQRSQKSINSHNAAR
jgi:hypothetical protein